MSADGFADTLALLPWEKVEADIRSRTATDVEAALRRERRTPDDLQALLSPAAAPRLEEMARLARDLTLRRFGRTMQMYVPLYLSNECQNMCVYCGFRMQNELPRKVLTDEEILREVAELKRQGFDHVLLVSGESRTRAGFDYLRHALTLVAPHFAHVSMEVQPLEEEEYRELAALGLRAVFLYQETYRREVWRKYHPKGRKAHFDLRLAATESLGKAGLLKAGLGVLLGLEDWRTDSFFLALHLAWLKKHYWRTRYSVSFPRLRPSAGGFSPEHPVGDRELAQLICAWRLFDPDLELALSTRESARFRDGAMHLGITHMSAGSRTSPGGYTDEDGTLAQFEIHDARTPAEVAGALRAQGFDPVWKDWDQVIG